MVNSCLLCGVGGQGTVLASKLIAFAAMEKGNGSVPPKPSVWPSGEAASSAMSAPATKSFPL